MAICRTCGHEATEDHICDRPGEEARIASWLDTPAADERGAPSPEVGCTACGFAGDLIDDSGVMTCPACLVVIPSRRVEAVVKVARVIVCSECGCEIGLAEGDEGKSVICPSCSCFLGTFIRRRPRGRG
jgi:hypothetical protein